MEQDGTTPPEPTRPESTPPDRPTPPEQGAPPTRPVRRDRPVTRRAILGGIAGGTVLGAGLGAWTGLGLGDDDTPPEQGAPPTTLPDDSLGGHPPADPQGVLRVDGLPRRDFYSKPSSSGGQTFGDLFLAIGARTPAPVVVMVHGGGWLQGLDLVYLDALCRDLASFGVAVWNVEYRRAGFGGGWPTTVADVCDAVDHLPTLNRTLGENLDLSRVVACGHSAGGHLALWLASRGVLPDGLPGARPVQKLNGVVSLAGVADLLRAEQTGDRFVADFLGGQPKDVRQRYVDASPVNHLPTGIPVACVHGQDDRVVRPEQSELYVRRAREAGDPARLEIVPGGHDPWGDIGGEPWKLTRGILFEQLGLGPMGAVGPPLTPPGAPAAPAGAPPARAGGAPPAGATPAPRR